MVYILTAKLSSLTLGNFAVGTGALIVPGMIGELATDLGTSPGGIGVVISAFALMVCVGGPFLAAWSSTVDRRKLLVTALVFSSLMHFLSGLAPNYTTFLLLRIGSAVGAAVFTAQAAATASLLVPNAERGKAIGMVILGYALAAVVGLPLGSYLSATIGWRFALALIGIVSLLSAWHVWRQIPRGLFIAPLNRSAWKSLFVNRLILLVLAVTAIQATAQFIFAPYITLVSQKFIGADSTTNTLLFALFGLASVLGNVVAARSMERVGPALIALVSLSAMCLALSLWPLSKGSHAITFGLVILWGVGCFAVNTAQQTKLVELASSLAPASIALNSSAMYLGQAIGAATGGFIFTQGGMDYLPSVAAVMMGIALLLAPFAMSYRFGRTVPKSA
jgi:predicted MFS family arabinose efflux permease